MGAEGSPKAQQPLMAHSPTRGREVPGVPPAVRGEAVPGGGAAAADADDGSHRPLLLLDDAAHGCTPAAGAEGGEVLLTLTQPPRGPFLFS